MDVINFSGGGPAERARRTTPSSRPSRTSQPRASCPSSRPATTATTSATARPARPAPRPRRSRSRRSANRHVFAPVLTIASTGASGCAFRPAAADEDPGGVVRETRRSSTSARGRARTAVRSTATSAAPANNPNLARSTLPGGSLNGRSRSSSRGRCAFVTKAAVAQGRGRDGPRARRQPRRARPTRSRCSWPYPAASSSDADGARLRVLAAASGGAVGVRISVGSRAPRDRIEAASSRASRPRGRPPSGTSSSRTCPLPAARSSRPRCARFRRSVRGLRRDEHVGAARRRRRRPARAAPRRLDAAADQVRARLHGRHRPGRTRAAPSRRR